MESVAAEDIADESLERVGQPVETRLIRSSPKYGNILTFETFWLVRFRFPSGNSSISRRHLV